MVLFETFGTKSIAVKLVTVENGVHVAVMLTSPIIFIFKRLSHIGFS